MSLSDSAADGTFYAYIDGVQYEGQSGYANDRIIAEWGERTNATSCSGWSGNASFGTWSRYNYSANSWMPVETSMASNGNCWSVSPLTNSNFTIQR